MDTPVLDNNQFTNKLFGGFPGFHIWWFAAFYGPALA